MSKRHEVRKSGSGGGKRFAHIAEQEKPGRRNTIRVGGDGALANIDFAMREQVAKVVVCPAVAQPELKHVTIQTGNQLGGHLQAGALCLEPTDKAVQSAHRRYAATPVALRSRSISAEAARS